MFSNIFYKLTSHEMVGSFIDKGDEIEREKGREDRERKGASSYTDG